MQAEDHIGLRGSTYLIFKVEVLERDDLQSWQSTKGPLGEGRIRELPCLFDVVIISLAILPVDGVTSYAKFW